jgi:glyoxylase-like metal-dependent hydrolase (beta-lactamase superfamily II)
MATAYTGVVAPGGPADVRELSCLTISKLAVDEQMHNNCYLLRCNDTGDQVLIDAAAEPERVLELIGAKGVSAVVTTHQHWDHHRALSAVVAAYDCEVIAGAPDAEAIQAQTGVAVTRQVGAGDNLKIGACEVEFIPIAGHTPGSISVLYQDPQGVPHLFAGDTLFPGGVGNTFGSAEDFAQLYHDVVERYFDRLPDNTWFYPGHGNDGELGNERPHLAEWKERGW